jgi:hypothetical protein
VTLLDPGDRAYADEQEHDAGSDRGEGDPEAYTITDLPEDGRMPDGSEPPGCPHPAQARRLIDGEQVCTMDGCGEAIAGPLPAIVPRDRPGTDPTYRHRTGGEDKGAGGLRYIPYDPANPAQQGRPYTPEQVELELVDTVARLEAGAGWLTTKEEERGAAKLAYELKRARVLFESRGRSAEQREAEALIACRQEYEDWQLLELTCKTAREGLHNLRAKGSYLQTVARSVGEALRGTR